MCGTGGDSSGTFNVSTAASFVVAAAGVPVAKHGNRSMTSKSGSADVLEAMGINISLSIEDVSECIDKIGIGFMFAPSLHPAMKHAMGARKSLGIRTVFNILGPLCNPAGVRRQLMGIYNGDLTEIVANVFKKLGSINAMIVHGDDGLDEITTAAKTKISHLKNSGEIVNESFSALEHGFALSSLDDLRGGLPEVNAQIVQSILKGEERGKKADIVILNAAAGILVGGKVENIKDGIDVSREMIDSGAAMNVLNKLMAVK
jgi:anthranilate phosphoribosyltransferase